MRRRTWAGVTVGLLALGAVLAAALGSTGGDGGGYEVSDSGGDADGQFFQGGGEFADGDFSYDAGDGDAPVASGSLAGGIARGGGGGGSGATVGSGSGASRSSQDDAITVAPPPPGSDRIVKDGTVVVELDDGTFDQAFAAVVALADRYGGTVLSSRSAIQGERNSGSVTVRVPAAAFERLLVGAGEIGEIRERRIDAQDVTAEFVDLEARLRHLRAQETFYLSLLERADGVADAIAVNTNLQQVQAETERVQGRLRWLDERSSFSRLTVELYERGAGAGPRIGVADADPILVRAWREAVDALQSVLGWLLVAAFAAAPIALLAAVGWALWRRARPARPAREREREETLPVG